MDTVFKRLIEHFGSQAAVARTFGVTKQAVSRWGRSGIPSNRALEVEEETRGRISTKEVLREGRPQ